MILSRIARALKDQSWLAVGIEFVIVILGVVISFQVTAWNADRAEQDVITRQLHEVRDDIRADITAIELTRDASLWRLAAAEYLQPPTGRCPLCGAGVLAFPPREAPPACEPCALEPCELRPCELVSTGMLGLRPSAGIALAIWMLTWKNGYCSAWLAVGRRFGSNTMRSRMSWIASALAFGIRSLRLVDTNCGNRKFICAASFMPSPHDCLDGDPSTLQIL